MRGNLPCANRPDRLADFGRPETSTFECQKRQLLERIEHSELAIELEPIDHAQRRAEADVFRSQISVAFADMAALGPLGQLLPQRVGGCLLQSRNPADARPQSLRMASGQQIVALGRDACSQSPAILGAIAETARRRSIEAAQLAR